MSCKKKLKIYVVKQNLVCMYNTRNITLGFHTSISNHECSVCLLTFPILHVLSHCSARCRVGPGSATERSSVWLARIGCWTHICVQMRQGQKASSHASWQDALASSGTSASGRRWVLAVVQVSCMQYQFGRYLWNGVEYELTPTAKVLDFLFLFFSYKWKTLRQTMSVEELYFW